MTTLRQAHKKQYLCVTNELCQNNNLTLRARGLMVYLLSLPDDWKIHINHLCKVMLEGRDAIITVMKELKKFGYIHHHKEGFQEGWQYFVFESPTSPEEFKEFLRTTLISQFTGKGNCSGNPQLQSNNSSTKSSSKIPKENITKDPPSADASDCFIYFLKKLKEKRPSLKEPNKDKWVKEFDLILRIDKRSKDEMLKVIDWIDKSPNKWIKANVLSPASLRNHYDKLAIEMEEAITDENKSKNRKWVLEAKVKYPEHLKKMNFDRYGVTNPSNGKDVSFSMEHEKFKEIFIHIFGGSADRRH